MKRKELYLQLALIGLTVGTFFSAFLTFISPLPIVFAFKKFGKKVAYCLIIATCVLVSLIGGVTYGIAFLVITGLIATVIGLQVWNKSLVKVQELVVKSIFFVFSFYLVASIIFFSFGGQQELSKISQKVDAHIDTLYKSVSIEPSILGLNGKTYTGKEKVKAYLKNNIVSFFVVALLAIIIINVVFLAGFFQESFNRREFFNWHVPYWFIWIPLLCGFIVVMSKGSVLLVFENIFRISLFPYFYQGVAITAFYLARKKLPAFFYVMVIVAVSTFLILPSTVIGFIDHWINFRKPRKISGGLA